MLRTIFREGAIAGLGAMITGLAVLGSWEQGLDNHRLLSLVGLTSAGGALTAAIAANGKKSKRFDEQLEAIALERLSDRNLTPVEALEVLEALSHRHRPGTAHRAPMSPIAAPSAPSPFGEFNGGVGHREGS